RRRGKESGSKWIFNQSSLYLDFLAGNQDYECTPWGNPTRNIFGWQRPCYLLGEGYASSFKELMETTEWDNYGTGRYEKCADCMVHCGYEPTAVDHTFSSFGGLWGTIKAMVFNSYANPRAQKRLEQEKTKPHGPLAHLGLTIEGKPMKKEEREAVEAA
ncbi:MAG: DUF3463 domain-containing protein, partial [Planctomycetota bacterium]